MQSFHWDTTFDTGLSEVDAQHKRLVEMINRLWNDTSGARAVPRPELEALLNELAAYAVYHFAEEEGMMRQADSPFIELHHHSHQTIALRVSEMTRSARATG